MYDWNVENMEILRTMWLCGHSGKEIGRVLSCNRNVIIGKVHRLHLVRTASAKMQQNKFNMARSEQARLRREACGQTYKPRRPSRVKKLESKLVRSPLYSIRSDLALVKLPSPVPEVEVLTECRLVTLDELTETMCRWPIGNPIRYCGLPTRGPYCQFHSGIAHVPMTPDRKRKDQYLLKLT